MFLLTLTQPLQDRPCLLSGIPEQASHRLGQSSRLSFSPLCISGIQRHRVFDDARLTPRWAAGSSRLRVVIAHTYSIPHCFTPSTTLNRWYNNTISNKKVGEGWMGRGRGLKGHRRIDVGLGEQPSRRLPKLGGWAIGCICGWDGGHHTHSDAARRASTAPINHLIDHCLFVCKRCGAEKMASQMRPDYRYICLDCFSKTGNEWQDRNPIAAARHKRNHHLLKKFGMTVTEAERVLSEQGDVCAICRQSMSDRRGFQPHVDHDHATGHVRGILCFHCHAGLGQFGDNLDRLRAAITYLERFTTS